MPVRIDLVLSSCVLLELRLPIAAKYKWMRFKIHALDKNDSGILKPILTRGFKSLKIQDEERFLEHVEFQSPEQMHFWRCSERGRTYMCTYVQTAKKYISLICLHSVSQEGVDQEMCGHCGAKG